MTEATGPVTTIGDDTVGPSNSDTRYVDAGEVGRGGVGRVNNVRDKRLQRAVAMKKLDQAKAAHPRRITRFIEGAQIQAQLEHPNIAPIHDIGVDANGALFFTMKLVRGTSLSAWLDHPSRRPGSGERLATGIDIFLKICDAVSFAHSKGVLHRDLKPDNIMLGEFGEVYVMDWGLAETTDDTHVVTGVTGGAQKSAEPATRKIVGTPAYMAPEAARGEPCDERVDVFGLGAILYAIVLGKTVYGQTAPMTALVAARTNAVIAPEDAVGDLPIAKKLLRALAHALAPKREDRHPSVAALREEVHQFIRGGLHMPRREYAPGEQIVVEGEAGDTAFIILSGACEAYKTIDGVRQRLRMMGPGDVFGETAVLAESTRTASVEAIDTVTVLVIDRATLEEGLGLDTWLGALVKALANRFRELDAQVSAKRG